MWEDFLAAFALVLILEGMLPFFSPKGWKDMAQAISQMRDATLRRLGLLVMVVGVALLYWVRG